MPTTTLISPTVSVNMVGSRTDSAGAAVTDLTAEEVRFPATIFGEGYLTPATAWKVNAQASPNMTVKVGSDTAKADHYVVAGEVAGQGNYIVRLDVASQNVTIPAAHASLARVDEIYLVVRDNVYDASSRGLPQLGHRQGDNGGGNPGPDAAWRASALLARVAVAAGVTSIVAGNITDTRVVATGMGIQPALLDAKGDLIVASAADVAARLGVGANGHLLTADSAQATGVKWAAGVATGAQSIATAEATTSGSYTALATPGPAVTVTVGPLGIAVVHVTAGIASTAGAPEVESYASVELSGANTVAALDANAAQTNINLGAGLFATARFTATSIFTGLTAGSTTFTMKYRRGVGTDTAEFYLRKLGVLTY